MSIPDIKSMTAAQIMRWSRSVPVEFRDAACAALGEDGRKCAQSAMAVIERRLFNHVAEARRLDILFEPERRLCAGGFRCVAGVDEVGRGPLAGPVVAAAVVFSPNTRIKGLNDSKKLSRKKRELLYDEIAQKAISVAVGIRSVEHIERHNISVASFDAMRDAVLALSSRPDYVLVDGFRIPRLGINQKALVKGDALSGSIAAASIIAKVARDRMMAQLDLLFPEYGFCRNNGYGTAEHLDALATYGACSHHRPSFLTNILARMGSFE